MRLFVTLLAVAVLTGCAAQPALQSTPTAAPPVLVDVPAPAQLFNGDCSAMFSDAALSEAFGQAVTNPGWPTSADPEALLVEQAGGIHCVWGGLDGSTVLVVVAVPAAAVSSPENTECVATEISPTSCAVDVTANGIRLSGIVTADTAGADSPSRVATVEALFVTSAAAVAPVALTPLPDAWMNPTDCDYVASTVDWATALDVTEPLVPDYTMGTDAYASAVEIDLRGGRVPGWCMLYSPSGGPGISFIALGGGAWARDAVLAQDGAEVIDVDGFDLVVKSTVNGTVDIFDGVNWIQTGTSDEPPYAALRAIIDALNAQ